MIKVLGIGTFYALAILFIVAGFMKGQSGLLGAGVIAALLATGLLLGVTVFKKYDTKENADIGMKVIKKAVRGR